MSESHLNPAASNTRPRLLLVDDDAAIGRVVARMLRERFDVTVFTSARDAVARIAAGEHYDVILCDLMMPEVTGMDVYEQVVEIDSLAAQRIIFLTGGAFTPRAEQFLRAVKNRRLEKPFDRTALNLALDATLEERAEKDAP